MRNFKMWFARLLCLLLAILTAAPVFAETDSSGWQNYIVLLDMSGSTNSVSNPTDLEGLRFSAARLLCSTLDSDKTRVGLIFFGGSTHVAGPVERKCIGVTVTPALNDAQHGNLAPMVSPSYTNIGAAMQEALNMAGTFDPGDKTTVILITDGLNDVNNTPEIDADDQNAAELSKQCAAELFNRGVAFYAIALTAGGSNQEFLSYINEVGLAGGGSIEPDGSISNVLEARAETLADSMQLIYMDSTNTIGNNFQAQVPVNAEFEVPYASITEVSVTVLCATEAKSQLAAVRLCDPNGVEYEVWNPEQGCLSNENFAVTESVNWVGTSIKQPLSGVWNIIVPGDADAGIYVRAYISMGVNVEINLNAAAPETACNEPFTLNAAFMRDGSVITEQKLYDDSQSELTLISPSGMQFTVPMTTVSQGFSAKFTPTETGSWNAYALITNPIMSSRQSNVFSFNVTQPTYTPVPLAESDIIIDVNNQKPLDNPEGIVYLDENANAYQIAWQIPVPTENVTISYMQDGDSQRVPIELPIQGNSVLLDASRLTRGETYTVTVSAIPQYGSDPISKNLRIAPYPFPADMSGLYLTVNGDKADGETALSVGSGTITLKADCSTGKIAAVSYSTDNVSWSENNKFSINEGDTITVYARVIPQYGSNTDARTLSAVVTRPVITPIDRLLRLLPFIGGAIVLILAVIITVLVRHKKTIEKNRIHGELSLVLPDGRTKSITFGNKKGTLLMSNSRLEQYSELHKWIQDYSYLEELANATVQAIRTDSYGTINGDGSHIPNTNGLRVNLSVASYDIMAREDPVEVTLTDKEYNSQIVRFTFVDRQ